MSHNDTRIAMATPEEVARYASPASQAEPSSEAAAGAAAQPPKPAVETTAEAPKNETAVLHAQVAELQDKFLRAKADAQNIARRAQQERVEAVRYGNAELLKALLPVVDDFERTLAAAAAVEHTDPVIEGVKLVHDKLMKLLKDQAVEVIEAQGKPFDPAEHAAVLQQPSDQHAPGTVILEVQKGYRLWDRVLRPTQVVIAQAMTTAEC